MLPRSFSKTAELLSDLSLQLTSHLTARIPSLPDWVSKKYKSRPPSAPRPLHWTFNPSRSPINRTRASNASPGGLPSNSLKSSVAMVYLPSPFAILIQTHSTPSQSHDKCFATRARGQGQRGLIPPPASLHTAHDLMAKTHTPAA
jgi:hypothetical protein